MRLLPKIVLLFFLILFKQLSAEINIIPQTPDSVNNSSTNTQVDDFGSLMFQNESFISSNSKNDSVIAKVTSKKRRKRIEAYYLAKLKLKKDSITIDSINVDSIAFIFYDTIYDFNFKVNFLESLPIIRPKTKKIVSKAKPKNNTEINNVVVEQPKNNTKSKKEFYVITIIIILLLFAWINIYYRKTIGTYFQAMYNFSVTQKLFLQNNIFIRRINFATFFLFIINVSLLLVIILDLYDISIFDLNNLLLLLIIIAILLVFYLIKITFYKIMGYILGIRKKLDEYYFNTFIFNKVLGIILLPINIILPFIAPEIAVTILEFTLIIVAILFVLKLLKGVLVAISLKFPIIYLILYLCALEILPLLAFAKFINS